MEITVRPATETDLPALAAMDLTYSRSRSLALTRSGEAPQHTFAFQWRDSDTPDSVYENYTVEGLRQALTTAKLFIMAEADGSAVGLLMILLPGYTDAGEISDFAVHRPFRKLGVGRRLLEEAVAWAKERRLRALWVEPRADNPDAIEFYTKSGFRLSGFNDRMYSNRDDERPTLFMYLELE